MKDCSDYVINLYEGSIPKEDRVKLMASEYYDLTFRNGTKGRFLSRRIRGRDVYREIEIFFREFPDKEISIDVKINRESVN